jgi:hypothetical protein
MYPAAPGGDCRFTFPSSVWDTEVTKRHAPTRPADPPKAVSGVLMQVSTHKNGQGLQLDPSKPPHADRKCESRPTPRSCICRARDSAPSSRSGRAHSTPSSLRETALLSQSSGSVWQPLSRERRHNNNGKGSNWEWQLGIPPRCLSVGFSDYRDREEPWQVCVGSSAPPHDSLALVTPLRRLDGDVHKFSGHGVASRLLAFAVVRATVGWLRAHARGVWPRLNRCPR